MVALFTWYEIPKPYGGDGDEGIVDAVEVRPVLYEHERNGREEDEEPHLWCLYRYHVFHNT